MKILVDTNVIINYLSGREDNYAESSDQIMMMCAQNQLEGYVAFHSLSTIWYWSRRYPEVSRRNWMRRICSILTIASADNASVLEAVENMQFPDFEDNLQDCCAVNAGVDYIVTVNVKDFEHSKVKAVTPDELVRIVNGD